MMETFLVMNDLQIEFEDAKVIKGVLKFARWLKPKGVILAGDVVDCYAISDFDRNPDGPHDVKREVSRCSELLRELTAVVKRGGERIFIGGNHEDRFRRLIWKKAPGLAGAISFESLFKIEENGFKWLPYGDFVRLGKLLVTHGFIVRSQSAYSARAHLERFGSSVLHGHTHRLGTYYATTLDDTRAGYENGHLCVGGSMDYVAFGGGKVTNWQQGFSVVHVGRGGFFHVQQIPILNREVFFYGDRTLKI